MTLLILRFLLSNVRYYHKEFGFDGFRFDAAKHIETEKDKNYGSSFWSNTLGVAKDYYKEKTGNELFAYGEILNEVEGSNDRKH